MVLKSIYRGFVAPLFTPFGPDGVLNVSEVPKYAQYLRENNIDAVLVNGTYSEGYSMNNDEREKLAEAWVDASKNTNQKVMVHVGGTNLNNVVRLAKHAEAIGAWSILCLPDLYYKPKTVSDLVDYLKIVGEAAPNTPLFYYHNPPATGVSLGMVDFLNAAFHEIPSIAGVKYCPLNLDEATRCLHLHDGAFTIYLTCGGCGQTILPALSMGYESLMLNIFCYAPEEPFAIKKALQCGRISDAQVIQKRISRLTEYMESENLSINGYKAIISMVTKLNLGNPRPPLKSISNDQLSKLESYLKQFNWLKS